VQDDADPEGDRPDGGDGKGEAEGQGSKPRAMATTKSTRSGFDGQGSALLAPPRRGKIEHSRI